MLHHRKSHFISRRQVKFYGRWNVVEIDSPWFSFIHLGDFRILILNFNELFQDNLKSLLSSCSSAKKLSLIINVRDNKSPYFRHLYSFLDSKFRRQIFDITSKNVCFTRGRITKYTVMNPPKNNTSRKETLNFRPGKVFLNPWAISWPPAVYYALCKFLIITENPLETISCFCYLWRLPKSLICRWVALAFTNFFFSDGVRNPWD